MKNITKHLMIVALFVTTLPHLVACEKTTEKTTTIIKEVDKPVSQPEAQPEPQVDSQPNVKVKIDGNGAGVEVNTKE